MRMTDEQFQTEVFRRSRVYMEQRRVRRRHLRAGALVFAGCFVLMIAGVGILPRIKNNDVNQMLMLIAETATAGHEDCDSYQYNEAADEADENYSNAEDGAEPMIQGSYTLEGSDAETNNASGVKSDSYEADGSGEATNTDSMSDAELFAMLGITALPERLGGCVNDHTAPENPVVYADAERYMIVRLSAMPDAPDSVTVAYESAVTGEKIAQFTVRGVQIHITASECTQAQLETAVSELLTYLQEEGSP